MRRSTLSSVVLPNNPDDDDAPAERSLRERGEQLLERSRDVWGEEETHPAYARILDDLAPDEARILLLLLRGGPQPSVDVRTGGPVGMVQLLPGGTGDVDDRRARGVPLHRRGAGVPATTCSGSG